jgi:monothiol glutaredoxin
MDEAIIQSIKQQIAQTPIILFMKGNATQPQCGFSARAVQALQAVGAEFSTVDVLANPDIRRLLPQVADWPTFPQLFVNGELIGGCDIILELYQNGELQKIIAGVH